jgi:hypothetical protein
MTGPEIDLVTRLRNLANWIRLIARTEDRNTCDDAAARIAELETALREIAESDDIDNALDPARNKRVAIQALAGNNGGGDA